jgi:dolichyl-phosphate-mannose-protein mannosyltransferase
VFTPTVIRRALFVVAWIAAVWAVMAAFTGGVGWLIGPIRLSSRQPYRIVAVALIAALYCGWRFPRHDIEEDARWFERILHRVSPLVLLVVVLAGCGIGIGFGSFAAAGSDSYGYVSQAGLWLNRQLRTAQPWVDQMSWPFRGFTFAPLGYRPMSGPEDGTIVPTYAPGLPILMAGFQAIVGSDGPYYVVPILGALALWLTYLLGREVTGSREAGVFAAALLLASPPFLSQLMVPMTDVPVAAGWALVCLLALKNPKPRAFTAGVAAGASLLIRPNLLLLLAAPISAWVWPAMRRKELRRLAAMRAVRFGAGLMPAIVAIAALNNYLYGSPLRSGYGGLTDVYALAGVRENIRNYGLWLVQAHTVLVGLALIPFFAPGAIRSGERTTSARACLGAMMALTFASYIFYSPFSSWTYLRFLLPGFPMLFVLMGAAIRLLFVKLPVPIRACIATMICVAAVTFGFRFAHDQYVFNQRPFEQRYVRAARYVDRLTPPNAVIFSMQHSGSLRYYAHRITLRYDWVYDYRLDTTIRELQEKGYRPYIVLDDGEIPEFRKRFAQMSRVGRLDWTPLVRVTGNPEVHIYDPEGRAGDVPSAPAR